MINDIVSLFVSSIGSQDSSHSLPCPLGVRARVLQCPPGNAWPFRRPITNTGVEEGKGTDWKADRGGRATNWWAVFQSWVQSGLIVSWCLSFFSYRLRKQPCLLVIRDVSSGETAAPLLQKFLTRAFYTWKNKTRTFRINGTFRLK